MQTNTKAGWRWLTALAVGLAAVGCGSGGTSRPTVSGLVQADAPVASTVTLRDSSGTSQLRTAGTAIDGSFSLDVSGLTPPFLLRAEWTGRSGNRRLFGAAAGAGTADVNQLTDLAFAGTNRRATSDDEFARSESGETEHKAAAIRDLLLRLRAALAPLFDRYHITDPTADPAALRQLLSDVRFTVRDGTVTVTNRKTGGVIFTGPLSDLASGTFHPENLPPGPTTAPPPADGAALYGASCASCHGPLATSQVHGASASDIREAIDENEGGMGSLRGLTLAEITAIAAALAGSAPPPPAGACTSFTYSAWGACQPDGTQTRTVLTSSPAGCTGGSPVTTQACSSGPPIDGAALYTQYCAGCHGNSKKGSSASAIQGAIDTNRGGMGTPALRALTPPQIAAIAAAP